MKTLRNNFTTPEQSRRLLAAGLPIESADMYYLHADADPRIVTERAMESMVESPDYPTFPCWSVGRLVEIDLTCAKYPEGVQPQVTLTYTEEGSPQLAEGLVYYFESGQCKYDYSKLNND